LRQSRYDTFEDLTTYCYGVASTVGLMSMHITGFNSSAAIPFAVKSGVALQLTNILRDVGEDFRAGRVYLPQEELADFGLTEDYLAAGQIDNRWRAFMRFQIDRTRRLYAESQPGVALLHPDGRLAIAAAAGLYSAILDDIEAHDYDVFTRRAHVSGWGKLRRLPGLWWQSLTIGRSQPQTSGGHLAPLLAHE
jgi:phytoene synthase